MYSKRCYACIDSFLCSPTLPAAVGCNFSYFSSEGFNSASLAAILSAEAPSCSWADAASTPYMPLLSPSSDMMRVVDDDVGVEEAMPGPSRGPRPS